MKPSHQKTDVSTGSPVIKRIEKIHPFKMINYLIISASCLLFAFIIFLFIKYIAFELDGEYALRLPRFFVVSTLILFSSFYYTSRVKEFYENDQISMLRRMLSRILIVGLLYFMSQSVAWIELLNSHDASGDSRLISYLIILSGTHLLFTIGGMVIAAILFYRYMLIEDDPVKTLIVTTNPTEKARLEIYRSYWNFITVSWIVIFLMLLFIF